MPRKKKSYTPRELMEISIKEMKKSKSEHTTKLDPKVGAVLATKDGRLLSTAFRGEIRAGNHAEFVLIERKNVNNDISGCVVYTTLEPCVDRNPPKDGCGFRIIDARISKVYIGHPDPDPTVAGNGAEILRQNNIEVEYYDRDLESQIHHENQDYLNEAIERAKKLSQKELSPPVSSLEQELTTYDFTDFSEKAMNEFINRAKLDFMIGTDEFKRFLMQRRFVKSSERNGRVIYRPTALGLLLLGKKPETHFENSIIKFTTYTDDGNPLIKDFKGALVLQPPDIEHYLEVVIPKSISREKFRRETIVDIPIKVFREVIINAMVHRDYNLENYQIKVNIYSDRIEVHSPGIPKFSLDRFNSFNVPAISPNSKIAFMFDEMELMEGRGFGMDELQLLPTKYGIPRPEFKIDENYFIVTIYRRKGIEIRKEAISKLNKSEIKGYDLINQLGPISASEYSEAIGVSTRTAARHFEKMLELDLIISQGKGRSLKYKTK